jgi:SAM-dependent methyltransferase
MTSCCSISPQARNTGRFFSKHANRYAKRFRRKGLERVQRYLLEGIMSHSVNRKHVLDIGCGVGSLHLTLLKRGSGSIHAVDLSEGMIEQARKLAAELGFTDRIRYTAGDFAILADTFERTDIVILDKVVCCYEDAATLTRNACVLTGDTLALSYPRNSFAVRWVTYIGIYLSGLFRLGFRTYWHDWDRMHRDILSNGFENTYSRATLVWQVRVYRKINE